jgi:hypothetical protein
MISHFSQRSIQKGLGFIMTANWLRKCSPFIPIRAVRRGSAVVQRGTGEVVSPSPLASSFRGAT